MELIVRSLLCAASLRPIFGSTSTSKPLCPAPTFFSLRGMVNSKSCPPLLALNTPKSLPTKPSLVKDGDNIFCNFSCSKPKTSTSQSLGNLPIKKSRGAPPTI